MNELAVSVANAIMCGMTIGLGNSTARWAVVDVETSGTDPRTCRVLSVAALALTDAGTVVDSVVSLLDAGVDPGPTHIHGLTRQMLSGQPRFGDIAAKLAELLRGRTLVAHNVGFDYSFLAAEAQRAGVTLPIETVMCTVELANRLDLGVASLKLAALAEHWGIAQLHPHDALDDATVLTQVLTRQLALAHLKDVKLPMRHPRELTLPVSAQPAAA